MTTQLNPYTIKWMVFVSTSEKFNRNYSSALKKAGFIPMGNGDVFVNYFVPSNEGSQNRMNKKVHDFRAKEATYKHRKGYLMFTITDKQFGLIGKNLPWNGVEVPTSIGRILVTQKQFNSMSQNA